MKRARFSLLWLCVRWVRLAAGCAVLLTVVPGNELLRWNTLMIDAIRSDNSGPTLSTRNLAIMHVAIFDAVNSVTPQYQPYQMRLEVPAECSAEAAVAACGHTIMNTLYPGFSGRSDSLFSEFLAQSPETIATTNGIALGRNVARIALDNRSDDGATTDVPYIPSEEPGAWRRTPPFYRPPVAPHWRYVDFFALPAMETFLPGPPPALESPEYAAALNEVKAFGAKSSSVRTSHQSETAIFWSDFSYTSMPPGHWHIITDGIARSRQLNLLETARLFALISIAQADAAIVCWEAKYRYNFWRPVTAIQRAGEDNNALTDADLNWTSHLNAPPFPAYISGHSTFSKASAEVIAAFFGTDNLAFEATSDSLPGVVRTYGSLSACADEIGLSRIYGGIHFSFDNEEGKKCGKKIGQFVAANYLLPSESLPFLVLEQVGPGRARLRLHGEISRSLVLQRTSNFQEWINVSTNIAIGGGITVDQLLEGMAFFRLQTVP